MSTPLQRVIVVLRHGERERLLKHQSQLEETHQAGVAGGPDLDVDGLAAVAAAGRAMRARYLGPNCSACIGDSEYRREEVRVDSSALARTLGTAEALLASLFPPGSRPASGEGFTLPVPVYSAAEAEDTLLRAYTKCPRLLHNLAEWQRGSEFEAKATATAALRARVGTALAREGEVPLADWFNAYDAVAVADADADPNADPDAAPVLSAEDAAATAALAAWLESRKFGAAIAGNRCGGRLLGEVGRLAQSEAETDPKLQLYSAHYPTMLCLLSALGVAVDSGDDADLWLGEAMLPLSSALAFEVHAADDTNGGSGMVRLWFLAATDDAKPEEPSWRQLRLPCATGSCTLTEFGAIAAERALPSVASWCLACENTALPQCQLSLRGLAPPAPPPGSGCPSSGSSGMSPAVAALLGVLVTAFFFLGIWCLFRESVLRVRAKPVTSTLALSSKPQAAPRPQGTAGLSTSSGLRAADAV